jgi:hypothetical protein
VMCEFGRVRIDRLGFGGLCVRSRDLGGGVGGSGMLGFVRVVLRVAGRAEWEGPCLREAIV